MHRSGRSLCVLALIAACSGCAGLAPIAGTCCSGPDHDCAYPADNNNEYVGACRHGVWVDVKMPPPMP